MALVRIEMQLFESTHRMQWFLRQLWAMIGKIVERQRSVIVRIGPITLHYRLCFNTIRFGTVWISKSAVLVHTVHGRLFCKCTWSTSKKQIFGELQDTQHAQTHTLTQTTTHTNSKTHVFTHTHAKKHIEMNVCLRVCMNVGMCACCAVHVWWCVQFTVISQQCSTKEYL